MAAFIFIFYHYEWARCVIQLIANHNSGHMREVWAQFGAFFLKENVVNCKLIKYQ